MQKTPITYFLSELGNALNRKDGYIMGATGQDPKKWTTNSWWYTQYSGSQKTKALYWREHAARVWDCNGLAEGIYKDYTGVDINSKARYNYADWCNPKGTGLIPSQYRVPGAAVFWGDNASSIHHVAYLYKPVNPTKPTGDWYLIEARGVAYGVVQTKLNTRKPNFWGLMTKYFDYDDSIDVTTPAPAPSTSTPSTTTRRILKKGMTGDDVKEVQSRLIALGYSCGSCGVDGDYGTDTIAAVKKFQKDHDLEVDGEFGPKSYAMLDSLDKTNAAAPTESASAPAPAEAQPNGQEVEIFGGNCYVRLESNITGSIIGVAHAGELFPYLGQKSSDGWHYIDFKGQKGWVSGKYSRLI